MDTDPITYTVTIAHHDHDVMTVLRTVVEALDNVRGISVDEDVRR